MKNYVLSTPEFREVQEHFEKHPKGYLELMFMPIGYNELKDGETVLFTHLLGSFELVFQRSIPYFFFWKKTGLFFKQVVQEKKKDPYYDLTGVSKWLLIISFSLFVLVLCASCSSSKPKGMRAGKWESKFMQVTCPMYPQYKHYVRRNDLKMQNPEICPAYKNPRKAGFGQLSSW